MNIREAMRLGDAVDDLVTIGRRRSEVLQIIVGPDEEWHVWVGGIYSVRNKDLAQALESIAQHIREREAQGVRGAT